MARVLVLILVRGKAQYFSREDWTAELPDSPLGKSRLRCRSSRSGTAKAMGSPMFGCERSSRNTRPEVRRNPRGGREREGFVIITGAKTYRTEFDVLNS
jgi:hypothetical protein